MTSSPACSLPPACVGELPMPVVAGDESAADPVALMLRRRRGGCEWIVCVFEELDVGSRGIGGGGKLSRLFPACPKRRVRINGRDSRKKKTGGLGELAHNNFLLEFSIFDFRFSID